MNGVLHIKVVLAGDLGVSKTSILNVLSDNTARENVSELELILKIRDCNVTLAIWDTCGM